MDMKKKILDVEVKEVSDRVLEFTGSTEEQDRDGETISAEGWDLKNYKKNPVFMWAHNYQNPPIGKALKVKAEDGKLNFKIEFADADTYAFADTIYRLYKGGFLNATSVGFIPKEWNDGDGDKAPRRAYIKQELLELSAVPVPSNPNALQNAQEQGLITVKEFEAITKPEETDEFIRIPNPKDDKKHDGHRIRTIDIDEDKGISALYCGECKVVKTYLFDKDKGWTMAKAKKWVEDHAKAMEGIDFEHLLNPQPAEVSQQQILDELDYLIRLIDTEGMNEEVKEDAWQLVRELLRLLGSDIPIDIKEMIAPQKPEPVEVSPEKIAEIVAEEVARAIRKEKGAVD